MDEFEVLAERYGLKPQGKSAPMSASKRNVSSSSSLNPSWDSSKVGNANHASSFDDFSVFMQSSSSRSSNGDKAHRSGSLDDFGDFFEGGMFKSSSMQSSSGNIRDDDGFSYDALFDSASRGGSGFGANDHDIFGGIPEFTSSLGNKNNVAGEDNGDIFGGLNSKSSNQENDILGSFGSPLQQSTQVDDLLGGFGSGNGDVFSSSNDVGSVKMRSSDVDFGDDLIPGFGGSNSSAAGNGTKRQPQQSESILSEDPFVILESTSKPVHSSSDPLEEFNQFTEFKSAKHEVPKANSPKVSSIDELEEFAKGKPHKDVSGPDNLFGGKKAMSGTKATISKQGAGVVSQKKEKAGDDLDYFYISSRASSAPKSRPTSIVNSKDIPKRPQKPTHGVPASMKRASSATNIFDDLSAMFGAGSLGNFEEIEGESEERRRARLGRHERTQERVAKAVAEMNQRDCQTQQEQEERHRISGNIDLEIKQWVAGKEGNMRALLSSLQNVLWPECGWEAVSLSDLITSTSVKKVYRKAALCVHPDKVQQKGATVEQKYTAEKVFDILKEAWKKFDAEELG